MLAPERLDPGVGPHVDLQVGVLREGLPALLALVLHDLVVDLVLVPVEGVLRGEDPLTKSAVELCRLLVDRVNVSFKSFAVTVDLNNPNRTFRIVFPRYYSP